MQRNSQLRPKDIKEDKIEEYRRIFQEYFKITRSSIETSLDREGIRKELEQELDDTCPEDLYMIGYALGERRNQLEEKFNKNLGVGYWKVKEFLPESYGEEDARMVGQAMRSWEEIRDMIESIPE